MFSSSSFHYKNGAGYISSSLVVLSSKWKIYNAWGCIMWLLWHSKKCSSNNINQFIGGQLRLGRGDRALRIWRWKLRYGSHVCVL